MFEAHFAGPQQTKQQPRCPTVRYFKGYLPVHRSRCPEVASGTSADGQIEQSE
jgi:hypothetical protein